MKKTIESFLCVGMTAGSVFAAAAFTAEQTSEGWTGIIADGEAYTFNTTNDFVVEGTRLDYIKLAGGNSCLELADGFETGDWFRFGSTGYIRLLGDVIFNRYLAYSGSVQGRISNGGTATFNCSFECAGGNGWFQVRPSDNATICYIVLNRDNNKFAQLRFTGLVGIRLGHTDALYSTGTGLGGLCFNDGTGTGPGLDLNGYSTRVKALNGDDLRAVESWGVNTFALVKSAEPATLEVQSLSYSATVQSEISFPFKFTEKASFLFNASGKTLNLVNIVSTSSGDLGVANGTLVMKWNAGWSGETVTVTGGVFQVDSPKTFSNSNVCLTVTSPGAVVLNQDVYVDRLVIDGKEMTQGKKYMATDLDNFSGEGSISVKYTPKDPTYETYVWATPTEGASLSSGTWAESKTPDLTDGGATLTFSEGGASATVDTDISVYALQFLSTFPFTLLGTEGKTVTLANGIIVNAAASPTVTATVEANVEMPVANAAGWTIGANAALNITGNLSGKGVSSLAVTGDGTLYLSGDNSALKRAFSFSNPLVVVSNRTALGAAQAVFNDTSKARFDCLTNETPIKVPKTFSSSQKIAKAYVGADRLTFTGYIDASDSSGWFLDNQDVLGGIKTSAALNIYAIDGREHTLGGPLNGEGVFVGTVVSSGSILNLMLDAANSTYKSFIIRSYGSDFGRVRCGKADVFRPTVALGMGDYDTGLPKGAGLDLNGFDQTVNTVCLDSFGHAGIVTKGYEKYTFVTSATPASITFSGVPAAYHGKELGITSFSPTNALAFRGQAGLVYSQTNPSGKDLEYCLVNVKSDTTGPLVVNSGRLVFDWGAGWTATTNVTVNGGTLKIMPESADCAFGPSAGKSRAGLYLNGDGQLELAENVLTTVRALAIDGTYKPAGVYGGADAGLDADHTLSQLTGKGRLTVLRSSFHAGTILLVR